MRKILVVLLLAASGCAVGPDDVLVGAVYPTGGHQGPDAIAEWRGVELARDRANALGGVDGRRIRVRLERADSADAAPEAVDRLVEAGAEVVVGSYGSTISRPAAAAASRRGVVFWETGAVGELGPEAATGELVFRFPVTGAVLGREAVAHVRDRVAADDDLRYAVAHVDDVYGRAVASGAVAEIRGSGLDLAGVFPYDLRGLDARDLVRRVEGTGADALFVVAYMDDGVAIRRAVLAEDLPLVANIGTSSSYCHPGFGEELGVDAVGVFASDKPSGDVVSPDALSPEAGELLEWARTEYRQRHGEPMSAAALTGFAGAWALFHHVLPEADGTGAEAIAEAALEARLPRGALPNGSGLAFAPPGDPDAGANRLAASVIWEWVAPGEREVVWPPAFATA